MFFVPLQSHPNVEQVRARNGIAGEGRIDVCGVDSHHPMFLVMSLYYYVVILKNDKKRTELIIIQGS